MSPLRKNLLLGSALLIAFTTAGLLAFEVRGEQGCRRTAPPCTTICPESQRDRGGCCRPCSSHGNQGHCCPGGSTWNGSACQCPAGQCLSKGRCRQPEPPPPPVPAGWVWVEAGRFTMGSSKNEAGRGSDEGEHRVTLTKGFLLQATEVTQGQWREVMGNNPSRFPACGDNCPVEGVSWWDSVAYLNVRSKREGLEECYELRGCKGSPGGGCKQWKSNIYCEGDYSCQEVRFKGPGCKGYRLPTEAEWEYAARAGTTTATYNGDLDSGHLACKSPNRVLDPIAWFCGNSTVTYSGSLDLTGGVKQAGTHPVRQKRANAWGLYDMLGNVWEWCYDWYNDNPGGSATNPPGPPAGSSRVLRGGSWGGFARYARAACRSRGGPGFRLDSVGLRAARSR